MSVVPGQDTLPTLPVELWIIIFDMVLHDSSRRLSGVKFFATEEAVHRGIKYFPFDKTWFRVRAVSKLFKKVAGEQPPFARIKCDPQAEDHRVYPGSALSYCSSIAIQWRALGMDPSPLSRVSLLVVNIACPHEPMSYRWDAVSTLVTRPGFTMPSVLTFVGTFPFPKGETIPPWKVLNHMFPSLQVLYICPYFTTDLPRGDGELVVFQHVHTLSVRCIRNLSLVCFPALKSLSCDCSLYVSAEIESSSLQLETLFFHTNTVGANIALPHSLQSFRINLLDSRSVLPRDVRTDLYLHLDIPPLGTTEEGSGASETASPKKMAILVKQAYDKLRPTKLYLDFTLLHARTPPAKLRRVLKACRAQSLEFDYIPRMNTPQRIAGKPGRKRRIRDTDGMSGSN